ncbi:MAG TPA: LacI family DNA-binding transcriptional regulator [Actinospica sp.]|nr:LacI family DNA-binding transcriptional regulator [Actinospica sp.]
MSQTVPPSETLFEPDRRVVARERPTMKEVAALAGVSLKTVSRVVNEVPTVDPALVAKVRAAMDRLGFRPNLAASNLRRGDGRTHTIGLLVEDVANPFSAAVHRAVENYAAQRGVLVLGSSLDEDPERERRMVRTLVARRVDGLIIVPASDDHRYLVAEQEAGTAVVFVDRLPNPLIGDAVVTDNREAAIAGVEELIAAGHRRIAYLGDTESLPTARDRYAGYRDALRAAAADGCVIDPELVVHGLRTTKAADEAVSALLSRHDAPTALFSSQNLVTIGAVQALHRLGLHHRVGIVGFDDFPLAQLLDPGVTVLAQQPSEIGKLAAELLFRRMAGDASPAMAHVIPSVLIPRGSGEIPAA